MALDTWHGGKGVARGMKKIITTPKKMEGKTWHPQLTDKAASVKTAVYYQMKYCQGRASQLRAGIDNTIGHYKGNHSKCLSESRCRLDANYIPSKIQITDPVAEKLPQHFLHKLPIYKKAELYANCKDTHYVESYNNTLLQYHDKRIVFGESTYKMRTELSLLDWNENVDCPITSRQEVEEITAPRGKVGLPVHVNKTFNFKASLWNRWLARLTAP